MEGQLEQWLGPATHSRALLAVPSLAVSWETPERAGTPRALNDLKCICVFTAKLHRLTQLCAKDLSHLSSLYVTSNERDSFEIF